MRKDPDITYHVKAKDCKMQKMSASAFLCHLKKEKKNIVTVCVTRDKGYKPQTSQKTKVHTYPKGRTQGKCKTQLEEETLISTV